MNMTPAHARQIISHPERYSHDPELYRVAWGVLTRAEGVVVDFQKLLRPSHHIERPSNRPCTAEDIRQRLEGRATQIAAARLAMVDDGA